MPFFEKLCYFLFSLAESRLISLLAAAQTITVFAPARRSTLIARERDAPVVIMSSVSITVLPERRDESRRKTQKEGG